MNIPLAASPLPAAALACPRDSRPRNDYFCVTFCAYCLPQDMDGDSFCCAYGDPGLAPAPPQPFLPGEDLEEWWA